MINLGMTFTGNAEVYDAIRPSYPADLYSDLQKTTGLKQNSRILEVGAGTGQATAGLETITRDITCLEPGKELFDILRLKFPHLRTVNSSFEAFEESEPFNAVVSATAWHWVDKEIKYKKAYDLLADMGYLAILRHFHTETEPDAFHLQANQLLQTLQSSKPIKFNVGDRSGLEEQAAELSNCYFYLAQQFEYPWQQTMTIEDYLALRSTYFEVLTLLPEARKQFEKAVRDLAATEYDNQVTVNYTTVLLITQKA